MKDFTKDIGKEDSSMFKDLFLKIKNIFRRKEKPVKNEIDNNTIHVHALRWGSNTIAGNIADLPKDLHYINLFHKNHETIGSYSEKT